MISLHSKRENDFVSHYIQNKLNATVNPYLYIGKFSNELSKGIMGTSIPIVIRLALEQTVIINFFRIVRLWAFVSHGTLRLAFVRRSLASINPVCQQSLSR